ncbi:hypothetical protein SUGI_1147580 [Cryptomeria japonica]|nr:hypothetical protein SUGI_1147580 [Cryptomeria japonica]
MPLTALKGACPDSIQNMPLTALKVATDFLFGFFFWFDLSPIAATRTLHFGMVDWRCGQKICWTSVSRNVWRLE